MSGGGSVTKNNARHTAGGVYRQGDLTMTLAPSTTITANTPNNCVGSVPAVLGCRANSVPTNEDAGVSLQVEATDPQSNHRIADALTVTKLESKKASTRTGHLVVLQAPRRHEKQPGRPGCSVRSRRSELV